MPAFPRRVYVPARIQLQPTAAMLVLDADGVEQPVDRATIAVNGSRIRSWSRACTLATSSGGLPNCSSPVAVTVTMRWRWRTHG